MKENRTKIFEALLFLALALALVIGCDDSNGNEGDGGTDTDTDTDTDSDAGLDRQMFTSGYIPNVERGWIYTSETECQIPDDGSCGDGFKACDYDSCSECRISKSCGDFYLGLSEIDDPCGVWYYEKSDDPTWYIRASDTWVLEEMTLPWIQFLESGEELGATRCAQACLDTDQCVAAYYHGAGFDDPLTCTLLAQSEDPVLDTTEPYSRLFDSDGLNDIPWELIQQPMFQGIISVCTDPQQ